ncbi:SDR family NAD(P)-dependent oxidoreductase [Croceicoccus sediminis]|uniref:SDR family NAD(P)-dependent oxidoreductase n=1 Tax=Croceicoccus sediminis TaxID=2571150 RepID=UPI001182F6A9|nr:SDR family oxidoreductase [Croceicoccus sediminis]
MTDKNEQDAPTVVITGGGAGIGRGTALHFAGKGWKVAALDKDGEALAELSALLPGDRLLAIECDVGKEQAVADAFARIGEWTGGLDLLVNNAGIADPKSGPLENMTLEAWQGWIDASLTSAFLCSRAAVGMLRKRAPSAIVNVTSSRAVQSEPDTYAYAAAKGGLFALTHALAVSLGPDIRVNAVAPGWIETGPWQKESDRSDPDHSKRAKQQHPVGRIGRVEDIAEAIDWLSGEGSGFVTGQQIVIDGGMTRLMQYDA